MLLVVAEAAVPMKVAVLVKVAVIVVVDKFGPAGVKAYLTLIWNKPNSSTSSPTNNIKETEDDDKQEAEVGTDQEDEEGKKRKHHNVSARTGEDTLAQEWGGSHSWPGVLQLTPPNSPSTPALVGVGLGASAHVIQTVRPETACPQETEVNSRADPHNVKLVLNMRYMPEGTEGTQGQWGYRQRALMTGKGQAVKGHGHSKKGKDQPGI
ncbi:MAG: hypothetical protein FRX49_10052 [Trebouxia sp. A1-2]|nr:MAG: hypothetical protein FRX49_10052 [Trebouxia sp. A1-2]